MSSGIKLDRRRSYGTVVGDSAVKYVQDDKNFDAHEIEIETQPVDIDKPRRGRPPKSSEP